MKRLWSRTDSVFFKIFSKFLIIIVLLSSFNFFSFTFFKNTILNEIIENNRLNIENTAKDYEEYFLALKEELLRLYSDEKVSLIHGQIMTRPDREINYLLVNDVKDRIQKLTANRFLYADNVFLFFKPGAMLLEKDGNPTEERMFSVFYSSGLYAPSFWREQAAASSYFRIFPSAPFIKHTGERKALTPVIVKNPANAYTPPPWSRRTGCSKASIARRTTAS